MKGFSIIELMVVIFIVGIISTIAVPNYKRYLNKAKPNEAKANLASYYHAYQMMLVEFGCAPGNFVGIGFKPLGELTYRILAGNDSVCSLPSGYESDTDCVSTQDDCDCGSSCSYYSKSWKEGGDAEACTHTGPIHTEALANDGDPNTFKAFACTQFASDDPYDPPDIWSISHSKEIKSDTL